MLLLFPFESWTLLADYDLIPPRDLRASSASIDVQKQVLEWMVRFLRIPCINTSLCGGGFLHLLPGR